MLLARLHLAEGHAQDALSILARWQPEARTEERQRGALQSLILQALAYQVSGAVDQARATLLQALALARPAGYQRVWLDAGPAIVPLLKTLVPNLQEAPLAAYVRTLLHASSRAQPVPMPPQRQREAFGERFASSFLPEPLTPQEHRVLQLVAEGASNQEIATRLVVSLSTAKKHVANILSKLGAENRTQAIARARALDLL